MSTGCGSRSVPDVGDGRAGQMPSAVTPGTIAPGVSRQEPDASQRDSPPQNPGRAAAWPVAWSATPDPNPQSPPPTANRLPIPLGEATEISFPTTSPPLALAIKRGQPARVEAFDLWAGKSLGSVQVPEMLPAELTISPDGSWVAGKLLQPGPDHVRIWSLKTGREAGDRILTPGDPRFGPIDILRFATTDRLIGLRRGVGGGLAVVMDLAQNVPPRAFALASPARGAVLHDQAIGVSSGGRFLAALVGNALVVHELESGRCVGSAELPAEAADIFTCKELVFSPDGRRLATMTAPGGGQPLRLLEWDFATGQLVRSLTWNPNSWLREASGFVPTADGHPLTWLPDGSGWVLHGRLIWRPDEQAPQPAFGGDDTHPRGLLDTDRVAAVARDGGQLSLIGISLEGATLAGEAPSPRHRGDPQDAATGWAAAPDPATTRPRHSTKPLAFFGLLPQGPCFPLRPGRHGACAIGREYVVFDLESGQETRRLSLPAQPLPLRDVSPDGRYLLAATPQISDQMKFEVWNVATGKLAFSAEERLGRGDATLEFIGPARVLLSTGFGDAGQRRYAIWDVDAAEKSLEFTTREGLGGHLSNSHIVTPGGRLAVTCFQDKLVVHELGTGKLIGETKLPMAAGRVYPQQMAAAVMTLDGASLHALVRYQEAATLLVTVDLTSGRVNQRPVDTRELTAAAGSRLLARPTPWLPDGARWLLHHQAAVNVQNGEVVGPLGLSDDSSLLALADDRLLIGFRYSGGKGDPAIAIAAMSIAPRAANELTADIEALRPPPVVAEAPAPRPVRQPETQPASPLPSPGLAEPVASGRPPWRSTVDPPSDPQTLVPTRPFAMTPARNARLVPSERGGMALLVVDDDAEQAEVLSLATGKRIGEPFALPRQARLVAIDPDGRYVAHGLQSEVMIRDIAAGRSVTVRREGPFVNCRYLGFASDDRLVAVFTINDRMEIRLYEPHGGEPVQVLGLPNSDWNVRNVGLVISPGGRYLAALRYDGLILLDLDQRARQSAVLPYADTRSHEIVFRCDGLHFSPDGTRLAAVYNQHQRNYLTVWSMESGEPTLLRRYNRAIHLRTTSHSSLAPPLAWFPDGETLVLQGTILIDPSTGHPFWVLPTKDLTPVMPLSPQSMLCVDSIQKKLFPAPLGSEIATARRKVRSLSTLAAPPLAEVGGNRPATLGDEPAGGEAPTPDAFTAPLKRGPIRLASNNLQNKPDRIALSPAGILGLERSEEFFTSGRGVITAGALPPQRTVELETYDVASAKRLHRLEVPEPTRLLDVSPDGSLLLSGDDHSGLEGYGRLDVWSPRLGRHAAGWRPTPIDATFSELVTWARFVDKRHVLVLDASHLTLWQLPECRPVYTIATRLAPSLSPNRKYFVERKQGLIRDSLSGAALIQLAGFGLGVPASLLDTAFTPDGQQVVGVTVDGPQSAVVRWDFATGKRLHEFSIPPAQFNRMALLGDRGLLLLAQPYLAQHGIVQVDRQKQQIVTRLQAGGVHAASPDGIYWRTDVILEGGGGAYFARGFGPEDFSW